jgi:hypothetical protein
MLDYLVLIRKPRASEEAEECQPEPKEEIMTRSKLERKGLDSFLPASTYLRALFRATRNYDDACFL